MKSLSKYSILFLIMCTLIVISCSNDNSIEGKKKKLSDLKTTLAEIELKIKTLEDEIGNVLVEETPAVVSTQIIQLDTFKRFLKVQGKVESQRLAMISATMGGRLIRINVTEGSNVRRGTVLAEVDSEIANKQLEELMHSYEFVKTLFQKQSNLYEQKAISEVQFLEAKNSKESLELKIATVKRSIQESKIVAPFDGTIDKVFLRIGEIAAPGLPFAQLSGGGNLKVVANVSESYINSFKVGTLATVIYPEFSDTMKGKVRVISKSIDSRNRTFRVELTPNTVTKKAHPNMLCSIEFNDIMIPNSIIIHLASLQKSDEGYYVYIVENGVAHRKDVVVENIADDFVLISSGININDQIIVEGVLDVSEGQKIEIKNLQ